MSYSLPGSGLDRFDTITFQAPDGAGGGFEDLGLAAEMKQDMAERIGEVLNQRLVDLSRLATVNALIHSVDEDDIYFRDEANGVTIEIGREGNQAYLNSVCFDGMGYLMLGEDGTYFYRQDWGDFEADITNADIIEAGEVIKTRIRFRKGDDRRSLASFGQRYHPNEDGPLPAWTAYFNVQED